MLRILKTIIWITVITLGIVFWQYHSFSNTILTQEETTINITPGETYYSLLSQRTGNKILSKIYLRGNTPDYELQVGKYTVPAKADIETFLRSFQNPIHETDISLTFLEGWNIFDIDEYLVNQGVIKRGEFIEYSENFCNTALFPGSTQGGSCLITQDFHWLDGIESLEGYLYPDTYAINPNTFTVKSLARKMLTNFDTRVYKPLFSHADNKTIFELVTLASIVEKEERSESARPTVAGILRKRWEEGWMIGADITVCYAHRLTSQECKLSVTKYLYDKNEYNTRQKVGLPAGPIGNPSYSSISATLKPVDSPYYYYLHDIVTGKIYYGRTEAEHNRNKQLYLR